MSKLTHKQTKITNSSFHEVLLQRFIIRGKSNNCMCVFVRLCTWRVVPPVGVRVIRFSKDTGGHLVFARRLLLVCAEGNIGGSSRRTQHPARQPSTNKSHTMTKSWAITQTQFCNTQHTHFMFLLFIFISLVVDAHPGPNKRIIK